MLSRAGAAAIGLGVALVLASAFLDYEFLALVGVALLLAVVAAALSMLLRPQIDVRHGVSPERVTVGEPASCTLTICNVARHRSIPIEVADVVGTGQEPLLLPTMRAGESKEVTYPLPTARRAALVVGPLLVDRVDPYRFFHLDRRLGEPTQLFIHPRRHRLIGLPSSLDRSPEGPTTDSAAGSQVFQSLREYVPGDDRRLIHWKTTAKTGTLMVREHVDTTLPDVVVVLDNTASRYDGERFEEAVEIAASVIELCCLQGFPVQLHTPIAGQHDEQMGSDSLGRLLDRLAAADVSIADSDALPTLLQRLQSSARGAGLFLVSGSMNAAEAAAVSALARRYRSLTVAQVADEREVQRLPGARTYGASTATEIARQWNSGAAL